jgi:hypothetical protein
MGGEGVGGDGRGRWEMAGPWGWGEAGEGGEVWACLHEWDDEERLVVHQALRETDEPIAAEEEREEKLQPKEPRVGPSEEATKVTVAEVEFNQLSEQLRVHNHLPRQHAPRQQGPRMRGRVGGGTSRGGHVIRRHVIIKRVIKCATSSSAPRHQARHVIRECSTCPPPKSADEMVYATGSTMSALHSGASFGAAS